MTTSYHDDPALKSRFVAHVHRHQVEDRVLQGTYGTTIRGEWRGCAVACSLRSLDEIDGRALVEENDRHEELANRLGIPLELTRLQDAVFEGLAKEQALGWPTRFAEAMPVGRDLGMVWPKLALWLLSDEESGVIRFARSDRSKDAILGVSKLYERWVAGSKPPPVDWQEARSAAYAAYSAAAYAAAAAADAAADAAAAYADAAADAADYADAAAAAYAHADARRIHWGKIADKLVELLRTA